MSSFDQIIADSPEIIFTEGDNFVWSPEINTIYYPKNDRTCMSLLHEIGHAKLAHKSYQLDIQLVKMEADAWQIASELAPKYDIDIPTEHVENCMDTYRDWLLSRARCPECEIAGIQSAVSLLYTCINCAKKWKVPMETQCIVRRRVVEA
ncbi:MAG: hypothetical protein AAF413_02190 [Patescibacteria group bacterium]